MKSKLRHVMSAAALLAGLAVVAWLVLFADRTPSSVDESRTFPWRSGNPVGSRVLPTPEVGQTKGAVPSAAQQPATQELVVSEPRETEVEAAASDREPSLLREVTGIVRVASAAMRDVPMIDMSRDPECYSAVDKQAVPAPWGVHVDAANGLADVFVELLGVPRSLELPGDIGPSVVLEVCAIKPLITVARVGQVMTFVNGDDTLHVVRVTSSANGSWMWATPQPEAFRSMLMMAPEWAVQISCSIHEWEHGYICVASSGYTDITDGSGKYSIDTTGLSDGEYPIRMWHSALGTREGLVRLDRGQARFDFDW